MKVPDISNAKDPDLRTSLSALRRAGELARKTAIQTDTSIVINREGKIVRVSAEELSRVTSEGKTGQLDHI